MQEGTAGVGLQDMAEGQQQGCREQGSGLLGGLEPEGHQESGWGPGWPQCCLQTGHRPFHKLHSLGCSMETQEVGTGNIPAACVISGLAMAPEVPCGLRAAGTLPCLGQCYELARRAQGAGSCWIWLGGGIEMIVVDICLSAAAILISGARPALICLLILM